MCIFDVDDTTIENLFFCPRADLPFWSVPVPIFSEPGRFALTF